MAIFLRFADPISEVSRKKLQTFSDNILVQGITENRPPIFWFTGMNEETYDGIEELQSDYDNRYGA